MKITVDGVSVNLETTNLELTVDRTMPGAMIALVLRETIPAPLLVLINPPTQNAESPDNNPVAVSWPLHNTTGGPQISGGIEPYEVTYTPTRGSNFAVGVTQVTIDVTSADNQTRQGFFNVSVTYEAPPAVEPLDVVGPSGVTVFSTSGSPVAVTFAATATGGIQPYVFQYFEGATERFSGNSFAVGTHTIDVEASDSQVPPDTDDTHSFVIGVYNVGAAHSYFNALAAHGSCLGSWPLRSQANINLVTGGGNSVNTFFTYNLAGDTYPDAQDAMKFYLPDDDAVLSIPGNQQLRMPIGLAYSSGDTVLVIWDWYYGPEFRTNRGVVQNYKIFNLRSSTGSVTSGGIYLGTKIGFIDASAAGDVGGHYNAFVGYPWATGMVNPDTVRPTGEGAHQQHVIANRYFMRSGIWTRYIMEVRMNVLGSNAGFNGWKALNSSLDYTSFNASTWNMVSQWTLDEGRDATRLIYKVPQTKTQTHLAMLNFEFNTSANAPGQTGPFVGYGRNALVLRNYATNVSEGDTNVFQRPV